jgi:hypothetical protein
MKVQFTYSQEDLVDASLRFLRRSKTIKRGQWRGMLFTTLFYWLAIYVLFISLLKNPYLAIIEAAGLTALNIALYPTWHERAIKKRLRRFVKEHYGDKNDFTCEVELTPNEVLVKQDNSQTIYPWTSVKEVQPTHDSIDVFAKAGGVIIRNRAFESADQRQRLLESIQDYVAKAGTSQ